MNQQPVVSTRALSDLKSVLFDLDGCVYLGNTPLDGSREVFEYLTAHGIPFCIITNNATRTPRQYQEKLAAMGIDVPESTVLTAGVATALYLKKLRPDGASVYVVGEVGLHEPMLQAGFWVDEVSPEYVCVGLDQQLTYQKLKIATLAIRNGAQFIASNPDTTLPTEEGQLPGAGSILAAIATATGIQPTVIGKPSAAIIDLAIEMIGAEHETTAIIGDRLDTDVPAGAAAGIGTILVQTGVHRVADIPHYPAAPEWVVDDMRDFLRRLTAR